MYVYYTVFVYGGNTYLCTRVYGLALARHDIIYVFPVPERPLAT